MKFRNSGKWSAFYWVSVSSLLRRLVAGLSLRRRGFVPGSVHVGYVMDKVALTQFFFVWVLLFSLFHIILLWLSILIYIHMGVNNRPLSGHSSETSRSINMNNPVYLITLFQLRGFWTCAAEWSNKHEHDSLLECCTVLSGRNWLSVKRFLLPPSSGWSLTWWWRSKNLWNVGQFLRKYTTQDLIAFWKYAG
jgi:hypothetical protein